MANALHPGGTSAPSDHPGLKRVVTVTVDTLTVTSPIPMHRNRNDVASQRSRQRHQSMQMVWSSLVFGLVTFHVQSKMVGPRKAAFADLTFERFGPRVLANVACQLIGASKPPLARREVAKVRFLPWNTQKHNP